MELTYFTVVLCGALLIGVGIPLGIYLHARRGQGMAEFDVLSQAMHKSRQAWRSDEALMTELSLAVSGLKKNSIDDLTENTLEAEDENQGSSH